MRISPISPLNKKNLSFKTGNTRLYTDFDGTFFPFPQDILIDKRANQEYSLMNKMHESIKAFVSTAKDKFSIVVTTGRSRNEMQYLFQYLTKPSSSFFLPKDFIFRDGLEEAQIAMETPDDLVLTPVSVSCEREKNKELAKKIIRSVDKNITILEPDINKSMKDYGEYSLEYHFKLLSSKSRKRYVSVIAESNGLIEMVFSPNVDTKDYVKKFSDYYKKTRQKTQIQSIDSDSSYYVPFQEDDTSEYTYRKANTIFIKPMGNNDPVNKLDKPKEQVRKIVEGQKDDLVIVAGDGSNDAQMLNPLNYLDIYGLNIDKSKPVEDILSDPKVVNAIRKLPLICIIAGDAANLGQILEIKRLLDDIGISKILWAEDSKSELLPKIKRGMLIYSDLNNEYKYSLGYDLYRNILEY